MRRIRSFCFEDVTENVVIKLFFAAGKVIKTRGTFFCCRKGYRDPGYPLLLQERLQRPGVPSSVAGKVTETRGTFNEGRTLL
jgi:hypothetical protein